eukprot:4942907-Amphidinium_carterae.2
MNIHPRQSHDILAETLGSYREDAHPRVPYCNILVHKNRESTMLARLEQPSCPVSHATCRSIPRTTQRACRQRNDPSPSRKRLGDSSVSMKIHADCELWTQAHPKGVQIKRLSIVSVKERLCVLCIDESTYKLRSHGPARNDACSRFNTRSQTLAKPCMQFQTGC